MLAGCYLIHGGEPLQTEEIILQIKQIAAKAGYNNHMVFEVVTNFNWDELLNKCQNLDLFAEKSMVELRLHSDSINKQGTQALEKMLQTQSSDICILIRAPKLKPQTLNSKWVNHIHKFGKIELAKPVSSARWLDWIKQRLQRAGFSVHSEDAQYLARHYEGNLIAAAQCIQKLQNNLPSGKLELEQIRPFLDNFSHFTVFDLTDSAISGDATRTFNILHSLKNDGFDPVLILWALTREIRNLLQISHDIQMGINLVNSAQNRGIWRDRVPSIKTALNRLSINKLQQLLKLSKHIDTMLKGITPGNSWDALLSVCMMFAGSEILTMEDLNI